MARKIEVEIIGDARSLERAFGRATGRSNAFGKALKYLTVAGIGAAVVGLEQSVKAAMEAEASQARLGQAFKNAHLSMKTYSKGLDATEKAGRRLGFSDNEVRTSLGSLMTATGNYHKSLKLLAVAQNVARFRGIGLTDATKMMTMAMTGSQRAIKSMGLTLAPTTSHVDALKLEVKKYAEAHKNLKIVVDRSALAHAKLLDKMATSQNVIALVTKKTEGYAKTYSKTAAGGIASFRVELEHLKAELGKGVLPILAGATQRMTGFVTSVEGHLPQIRAQFGGLASAAGQVGKALVGIGSSRGGQSAIAGLVTTFVGSGLVGEAHSFVTMLKSMNPVLIAAGVAAGIFGGVMYAIMTSTSGLTLELAKAKQAVDNLKNAENNAVQAGQDLKVAKHQLTGAEIAHEMAVKNVREALRLYGKHSVQYRQALNAEKQSADGVVQASINVKNAHQGVRKSAVDVTNATKGQAAALDAMRARGQKDINALGIGYRGFQARVAEARVAAGKFASPQLAAAVNEYARAIATLTRRMGGTRQEANLAAEATVALARALGRLPTRKEINIIVTEQRRSSSLAHQTGPRRTGGGSHTTRQHGGFVPAPPGTPMSIEAHGGEIILNEGQQQVLGGPRFLSELFGFTGLEGPSYASGGLVTRHPIFQVVGTRSSGHHRSKHGSSHGRSHKPKHHAPHLPGSIREAEARAAGTKTLADDIAAYSRHGHWITTELGRGDLTRSERESLRVQRIRNNNRLRSLRTRQAKATKAREKDYSQLPARLEHAILQARLTGDNVALLAALKAGEAWFVRQLARKHLTYAQQNGIINSLISIRDEIKSLQDAPADVSQDLQAELDQANARLGVATRRGDLAEAFVETGVFGGGGSGGGGGGGGDSYHFHGLVWPPSPEVLRQVAAGTTQGLGMQGHRAPNRHWIGV